MHFSNDLFMSLYSLIDIGGMYQNIERLVVVQNIQRALLFQGVLNLVTCNFSLFTQLGVLVSWHVPACVYACITNGARTVVDVWE